ncbi:ribonuclease H-like domain-containing protein [Tanacetum coccineum]
MDMGDIPKDWNEIIEKGTTYPCNNAIRNVLRRLILAIVVYYIWKERNSRIFANENMTADNVLQRIIESIGLQLQNDAFYECQAMVCSEVVTAVDILACLHSSEMLLPEAFEIGAYCLCEYGLLAYKHAATPLQQNVVLSHMETDNDKFLANMTKYQKLVGKLIYLFVTRPGIVYAVHCLSQRMHSLLQSHFTVALRVLRYLKQTRRSGI